MSTEKLIAELRAILSESESLTGEPLEEKKKAAATATGADLERKAREKRKKKSGTKHLGAGRNPFKRKDHLGPGPKGGSNTKTGKWKCSCKTPYKCACRAGKRTKTIRISKDYKKSYNSLYKAHQKSQRQTRT